MLLHTIRPMLPEILIRGIPKKKMSAHKQQVRDYLLSHPDCQFSMTSLQLSSGRHTYGVMVSGVPVGDSDSVRQKMAVKTSKIIVSQIEKTVGRLRLA